MAAFRLSSDCGKRPPRNLSGITLEYYNENRQCVITGFRREDDDKCAFLRYYPFGAEILHLNFSTPCM